MKRHWMRRGLKFALFATLAIGIFSFLVVNLWNWLMPTLFGWHVISFWQALGLLALSKILFGDFLGRRGPHMYWRRRMMERWAQMTPEEREKFREGMRGYCGPFEPPVTQPKA